MMNFPKLSLRGHALSLIGVGFALSGCTALIDVSENCEDENCSGYICDAEGIACLTSCDATTPCAPYFFCDVSTGTCADPQFSEVIGERALSLSPRAISNGSAEDYCAPRDGESYPAVTEGWDLLGQRAEGLTSRGADGVENFSNLVVVGEWRGQNGMRRFSAAGNRLCDPDVTESFIPLAEGGNFRELRTATRTVDTSQYQTPDIERTGVLFEAGLASCSSNDECASGSQACVAGACRDTCSSSDDCVDEAGNQRPDYCDAGAGVCVTPPTRSFVTMLYADPNNARRSTLRMTVFRAEPVQAPVSIELGTMENQQEAKGISLHTEPEFSWYGVWEGSSSGGSLFVGLVESGLNSDAIVAPRQEFGTSSNVLQRPAVGRVGDYLMLAYEDRGFRASAGAGDLSSALKLAFVQQPIGAILDPAFAGTLRFDPSITVVDLPGESSEIVSLHAVVHRDPNPTDGDDTYTELVWQELNNNGELKLRHVALQPETLQGFFDNEVSSGDLELPVADLELAHTGYDGVLDAFAFQGSSAVVYQVSEATGAQTEQGIWLQQLYDDAPAPLRVLDETDLLRVKNDGVDVFPYGELGIGVTWLREEFEDDSVSFRRFRRD